MDISWLLRILICIQISELRSEPAGDFGDDGTDTDDPPCNAKLADRCFADVYANLECHLNPKASVDCQKKDVADLCSAAEDSLNCVAGIIDTDCTKMEGSGNVDAWLTGLRQAYDSFCSGEQHFMRVLLQNSQCWNSLAFVKCVEQEIRISHVVDLLQRQLNLQSCLGTVIAMASCNVKATNQVDACLPPEGVISEVIQTFFTSTKWCESCSISNGAVSVKHHITYNLWVIVSISLLSFIAK